MKRQGRSSANRATRERRANDKAQTASANGPQAWVLAIGVFAAAMLVRLIYSAQVSNCPLFQIPTLDSGYYYALARQFANGQWLHPEGLPYWQPPSYSAVLAVWMKMAGTAVTSAKNAQFVLGGLNCVLVFVLGSRVFNKTVGLAAGLAATLYGPMIYFDGELLTPTLQIFLNLTAILLLLSAVDKKSLPIIAASGAVLGLSLIVRPDVAAFITAALVWAALNLLKTTSPKTTLAATAAMAVCACLPVVPLAIRNSTVGKDNVLISANGGINFYIGNNADYDRTIEIRPGPEWEAMRSLPLKQDPDAKSSEQSDWFYRKGLDYAVKNPVAYLQLLVRKSVVFLTAVEGRRDQDLYFYRGYSPLFSILLFKTRWFAFPFGLVLPLAVFGLFAHTRNPQSKLLISYLATMFGVTVAFFVCSRYRITSVPILLIFAAKGALSLWDSARRKGLKLPLLPLILALGTAVISNANPYGVDRLQDSINADSHYSVAEVLCKQERMAAAAEECRMSIRLKSENSAFRLNYSRVLSALGKSDEAERELRTALKADPDYGAAHSALGELLAGRGDVANAKHHFILAARADAGFITELMRMAKEAYSRKEYPLSEGAMRAVVAIDPQDAEAREGLGMVLLNQGRPEEAITHLREAVRIAPELAGNHVTLGLAHYLSGNRDLAQKSFDRAVEIGPAEQVRAHIRSLIGANTPE